MEQGLPVAFENNAATWQNMPGMAAFYTGRQNQIAQDNIAALQKAFAEEQAFKAQERPITLENLVKSGKLSEANAQHATELARAAGLSSDKAAAVMPSEISSINAKNQAETAAAEQAARLSKTVQMAAWLNGPGKLEPTFRQAQQFMQTFGIQDSPDGSVGRKIIQDMPKISQLLQAEAQEAWKLSGAGQGVLAKEAGDTARNNATNTTNRAIAAGHDSTQLSIANTRANAEKEKLKNKTDFEVLLRKAKTAGETMSLLFNEIQRAKSAGEYAWADDLIARYNDPALVSRYKNEMNMAGSPAVTQIPGQRPQLGPRASEVPVVPMGSESPASTKPGHSLSDVKKMYPGVSDEQLKKAYKEKFGVDLK